MEEQEMIKPTGSEDHDAWKQYWAKSQPPEWFERWGYWRTEPEIPVDRQKHLTERLQTEPDVDLGIYPFRDENGPIALTRADVEWLLATHESDGMVGPVGEDTEQSRERQGLDLRGANLKGVNLSNLPLTCLRGGQYKLKLGAYIRMAAMLSKRTRSIFAGHAYVATETISLDDDIGGAFGSTRWRPDPFAAAQLAGANLQGAKLAGSVLIGANLQGSHLESADLSQVQLTGANLRRAYFNKHSILDGMILGNQRRDLYVRVAGTRGVRLLLRIGARLWLTAIQSPVIRLPPAALVLLVAVGLVITGIVTLLNGNISKGLLDIIAAVLLAGFVYSLLPPRSPIDAFGALLADIQWGKANLAVLDWQQVRITGDELRAQGKTDRSGAGARTRWDATIADYQAAVRVYRQLTVELRTRGLQEDADEYAYRAHIMQRRVALLQLQPLRWLGSLQLDLISGYGYRPTRSVATYLVTIFGFAALYWCVTHDVSITHGLFTEILRDTGMTPPPAPTYHLQGYEALVVSVTSFHGRGFFQPSASPGDKVAILAAIEAALGLLIEIIFIATFTQRFFSK